MNVNEESDDDSIATEDIKEIQIDPEPQTEETKPEPKTEPEPEPQTQTEPEIEHEVIQPKRRGRPRGKKNTDICQTIGSLTKAELCDIIYKQHSVLKEHDMEREKIRTELQQKIENTKVSREKKPRTKKQQEATQKLVERNKARRKVKADTLKQTVKQEVKDDLNKDISDLVQDEIVKIIQEPLRSLTPERIRKVKGIEEIATSRYKSKF